jgi:hypothetical protein
MPEFLTQDAGIDSATHPAGSLPKRIVLGAVRMAPFLRLLGCGFVRIRHCLLKRRDCGDAGGAKTVPHHIPPRGSRVEGIFAAFENSK